MKNKVFSSVPIVKIFLFLGPTPMKIVFFTSSCDLFLILLYIYRELLKIVMNQELLEKEFIGDVDMWAGHHLPPPFHSETFRNYAWKTTKVLGFWAKTA